MRTYDVIKKKRDGKPLTADEVKFLVKGYVAGDIPDYQMSAFLMAVFFKGMTDEETFGLTDAMRTSGDLVDLAGIKGFTVDKHSTGGVGDKTSLVLGPVLAALGMKVAKMSGRGLGHTGGTIDKLEAITGFNCSLDSKTFIDTVNKIGVAIVGQTGNLVPADKKMYALRDVTATVDSIPLIAASIMSKKLAVNNQALVLDVKMGSGAFMKTLPEARELARQMVSIGKRSGRKVTAVITNMDEPLGQMIGNALEVREAIDTLHGKGPSDFSELIKVLATEALLLMTDRKITQDEAAKKVQDVIASGKAFETFVQMVELQGGDSNQVKQPEKLPTASKVVPLPSPIAGSIARIDCEEIGMAAMMLGAGRETKDSVIDMAVGLKLLRHVGDQVKAGEALAEVHIDPKRNNEPALKRLTAAFTLTSDKVKPQPLILDIVS